jgi:hypothetical protein
MTYTIETMLGQLSWDADDESLKVSFRGRDTRALWREVTAAGLVESAMAFSETSTPPALFSQLSRFLPGVGKLADINENLAENYRTLTLARGSADSRAVRLPLPFEDEAAAALVDEVQQRVGSRWAGEIALGESYRRLGLARPWWTIPVTLVYLVALALTLLFACTGFAALGMILQGEPIEIPLPAWIGMGAWLLLIGGILFLYRRMWRR